MSQHAIHCALFRGGTSKGVFFEESQLPDDKSIWDDLLIDSFGSPDPMQLDGIGGSHSTTSKAVIVRPSDESGVDLSYRFGQVGIQNPVVDWGGNCGNLTFAAGAFSLDHDLLNRGSGRTELTLKNTNTDTIVQQSLEVDRTGNPIYIGDFNVDGVPGAGTRIRSRFLDPAGTETGNLLPTGNKIDTFTLPEIGKIEVSIVDASNPVTFVRANDIGLTGTENPSDINENKEVLEILERVRGISCEQLNLVDDSDCATDVSPGLPKVAFVGKRRSYETTTGEFIKPAEFDILCRIMSMQKAHHAYAVTGAMCTAAAALLPGTIPNEYVSETSTDRVRIGHPKGTLRVEVSKQRDIIEYTAVNRTARKIMDGKLYYNL